MPLPANTIPVRAEGVHVFDTCHALLQAAEASIPLCGLSEHVRDWTNPSSHRQGWAGEFGPDWAAKAKRGHGHAVTLVQDIMAQIAQSKGVMYKHRRTMQRVEPGARGIIMVDSGALLTGDDKPCGALRLTKRTATGARRAAIVVAGACSGGVTRNELAAQLAVSLAVCAALEAHHVRCDLFVHYTFNEIAYGPKAWYTNIIRVKRANSPLTPALIALAGSVETFRRAVFQHIAAQPGASDAIGNRLGYPVHRTPEPFKRLIPREVWPHTLCIERPDFDRAVNDPVGETIRALAKLGVII